MATVMSTILLERDEVLEWTLIFPSPKLDDMKPDYVLADIFGHNLGISGTRSDLLRFADTLRAAIVLQVPESGETEGTS